MSSKLCKIKDVTDNTTSWSVKVMVYDKTQPRQATKSPLRYQRITFIDQEVHKYLLHQELLLTIYSSSTTSIIQQFFDQTIRNKKLLQQSSATT